MSAGFKLSAAVLAASFPWDTPKFVTVVLREVRELRLKIRQIIKTKTTKGTNNLVLILLPNVKRTCTLITTFCIDWFTNKIGLNIFKLRAKSKFLVYTGSNLQQIFESFSKKVVCYLKNE
ncbi:hypothetical protein SY111_11710 [Ligilactobacillus agilis]|uniref:Uncharacterized protein n=1 Tax=Ligilactobacillus agilis TaxID=1601 RepID=A0A6F9XTL8_9LACO|nr:hypothetical protein SY111_11710 [Ligilactobacillus agilis]